MLRVLLATLVLAAAVRATDLVVHPVRVSHRAASADLWSARSWQAKCTLAESDADISADALFALRNRYLESSASPSPIEQLKARALNQTHSNVSADEFERFAEEFTLSIENESGEADRNPGVRIGVPLSLECEWRARDIIDLTGNPWLSQLRRDFEPAPVPLRRGRLVRFWRTLRNALTFLRKLAQLALGLLLHEHFSAASAKAHAWDQFKHHKSSALRTLHHAYRTFTSACAATFARIQTKLARHKRRRG
jgi:hypothetical protein